MTPSTQSEREDQLLLACFLAAHYAPGVVRNVLEGRTRLIAVAPHWERDLRMRTPAVRRAEQLAGLVRELVATEAVGASAAP